MYKMIACDLDGTLLCSDGTISKKTFEIINMLKKRGIEFVIATGRLDIMIKQYTDYFGNDFNIICCNGALTKNLISKETLFEETLSFETCEKVFEICKSFGVSYYLFCEGKLLGDDPTNGRIRYLSSYNETLKDEHKMNIVLTEDLITDMTKEKIYKIVISNEDKELLEDVRLEISKSLNVNSMRSGKNILDVFPKNASKGVYLLKLAEKLNIKPSEIMAFGDNQNDLDMIEKAGLGIAMGNAEENVKQIANETTLTNDEDGIYFKLKELFSV